MPRDFLPTPDAALDLWIRNFSGQLGTDGKTLGFSVDEVDAVANASNSYTAAFEQSRTANDAAKSATASKRENRQAAVDLVRPYARRLQAHPGMTDPVRGRFGLTMLDSPAAAGARAGSNASRIRDDTPLVELDFGTRGQITVHFGPNPGNKNRNGLPRNAIGAVIQTIHLSPAEPVAGLENLSGWQWLDNTTASPYVHTLTAGGVVSVGVNASAVAGASRVLAYRVAYLYRRARRGPWSAATQAAVTF